MECKSSYFFFSCEDIQYLSKYAFDKIRVDAVDNFGRFQGYEVTIYGNINAMIGNGCKLKGFKVDKRRCCRLNFLSDYWDNIRRKAILYYFL